MNITVTGADELANCLKEMSEVRYDAVKLITLKNIYNRAVSGGTPVDTGELRQSAGMDADMMGYTKDYAPHVEYGHRTRGGGYVEGQHYLQRNVETERPAFEKLVKNQIERLVR